MYRDIYYVLAYIVSYFAILLQPDIWVTGFHLLFYFCTLIRKYCCMVTLSSMSRRDPLCSKVLEGLWDYVSSCEKQLSSFTKSNWNNLWPRVLPMG